MRGIAAALFTSRQTSYWITKNRRTPTSVKLFGHAATCHNGVPQTDCPGCIELEAKIKMERKLS